MNSAEILGVRSEFDGFNGLTLCFVSAESSTNHVILPHGFSKFGTVSDFKFRHSRMIFGYSRLLINSINPKYRCRHFLFTTSQIKCLFRKAQRMLAAWFPANSKNCEFPNWRIAIKPKHRKEYSVLCCFP